VDLQLLPFNIIFPETRNTKTSTVSNFLIFTIVEAYIWISLEVHTKNGTNFVS